MSYLRAIWKSLVCKTIFAIGIIVAFLYGQAEITHPDEAASNLRVEVFAFASDQPAKGRIDIYIQIPYPEIKFAKEQEQYTGDLKFLQLCFLRRSRNFGKKASLLNYI